MDTTAKTLITGATGLVGSAVARKLVAEGFPVRALARPNSPRFQLDGVDLEFVAGDIRDADSIRRAMAGVRYVFHVAADYGSGPATQARFLPPTWTAHASSCRRQNGPASNASSIPAAWQRLGLPADGSPADETVPLSVEQGIGPYKRSKIAAERLVEAMVADNGLPAVIVNPSTPIGPRDVKPTPTGRIIVETARGRVPGFLDTGLNLVHVDDVAAGHIAALKRGVIGERYILGGESVARRYARRIARMVGRRPPRLRLHPALVIPVAYTAEATARLNRTGAIHDPRRNPHGRPPHVLHGRQSRTRPRLPRPSLPRGAGGCGPMVRGRRLSG